MLIIGIPLGLFIAFILLALVWRGDTKEIVGIADQFKPDSSWHLKYDVVEPPVLVCLSDVPCPNVDRTWSTGMIISKQQFADKLADAGWDFPIVGDCLAKSGVGGSGITLCSAKGKIKGFRVTARVEGIIDNPSESEVQVYLEEDKK